MCLQANCDMQLFLSGPVLLHKKGGGCISRWRVTMSKEEAGEFDCNLCFKVGVQLSSTNL